MRLTLNDNNDITHLLVSYTLNRNNDLSGGLSRIACDLILVTSELELKRCYEVELDLGNGGVAENDQALQLRFEVNGWTLQSDGTTLINLMQLDGKHYAKRPVYSKEQLANPNKGIRTSSLINDVLNDFNVPHSVGSFGDLQYGLVGNYDSDPIGVCVGLAVATGYLTYVTTSNNQVRCLSYNDFIRKQAVATANHVRERAGITAPLLDKVVVVGNTKRLVTDRYNKQTIYEASRSVFGTVEEETTTTIDAQKGTETSETNCMMKLVRPDTHPTSAQMIIKERSNKKTYSDRQGRITGYVVDVDRNTAAIAPETTNDSVLIKAERVEYSADFNDETSELYSTTETTYQAHVIGRIQLVQYTPSGIVRKSINPFTIRSSSEAEKPLTEEEENNQYISPLVLTKRVRITYTKIGSNKWRETTTITERQFISKTRGTNGAKNESQEVRTLGGMQVTQHSSRNVDSVPLAQTLPTNESEVEDTPHSLTFTGQTIPSVCGTKRVERIELAGATSQTYLMQAGKLQALPRLNQTHALNLIATNASLQLVSVPFAKLATNEHNLLPVDITYNWSTSSGYEYAGTFLVLSNNTRDYPIMRVPPPVVVNQVDAAGILQVPTALDSAPVAGVQQAIAKPLAPITTGTVVATINIDYDSDDVTHWYVSSVNAMPTIATTTATYDWLVLAVSPTANVELDEVTLDTQAEAAYHSADVTAYSYLPESTIQEVVSYQLYFTAYSYRYR